MSKRISIMLVLLLLVSGLGFVYGAVPSDVEGTKYEEAVTELSQLGILTGYNDGTFRPDNGINRAEACVVAVRMMGATASERASAKDSGFEDLSGYIWAEEYINYAVANGVVAGYSDTIFGPEREVTINEMAAMLINALGYEASELTGVWPANYYNKAVGLGIIDDLGSASAGNQSASRGDVAVMTFNALNIDQQTTDPDDKDDNSGSSNNNGSKDEDKTSGKDKQTDEEYKKLAGDLYDFDGRAYGIILGTATVVDKDGDTVTQIEFLKGNTIHYLNTDGRVKVPDIDYSELELYGLRMDYGIVKGIGSASDKTELRTNYLAEILGDGNIGEVTSASSGYIMTDKGEFNTSSSGTIVYVAKYKGGSIDKFQSGKVNDITEGSYVRAYTVTKDAKGDKMAEIVIVDKGK